MLKHTVILSVVTTLAFSIVGCGLASSPDGATAPDGESTLNTVEPALEEALPDAATLGVVLPSSAAKPGSQEGALVGGISEFWAHTATTSFRMNAGLAHILLPIRFVVNNIEPTYTGKKKAVWFGSTPLDPQQHLLVVRKVGAHYKYSVLARLKSEAGNPAAWRLRITGRYFPAADDGDAHGRVWVNLDTDLNPKTTGKVLAHWSNGASGRTITAFFFGYSDGTEGPLHQAAHFAIEPNGAGVLVHGIKGFDLNKGEEGKEALENAAMLSRWAVTGAGRGDLIANGGDIEAEGYEAAAMTQCWSAMTFKTAFEATAVKLPGQEPTIVKTTGNHDECVFAEAVEPSLPELGDEPAVEDDDIPEEATSL